MIKTESKVRVRYVETDAMGIAHHANYIIWFELARIEMMTQLGLPYKDLEAEGALMPVLEIHTEMRKPSYFDDELTIKITISSPPKVKLWVHYEVYREGKVIATGKTLHAFMNRAGRPIKPPKSFQDLIAKHFDLDKPEPPPTQHPQ